MWRSCSSLLSACRSLLAGSGAQRAGHPQVARPCTDSATAPPGDRAPLTARPPSPSQSVASQPQVARAFAELLILNAAAVGINNMARDIPTARPETGGTTSAAAGTGTATTSARTTSNTRTAARCTTTWPGRTGCRSGPRRPSRLPAASCGRCSVRRRRLRQRPHHHQPERHHTWRGHPPALHARPRQSGHRNRSRLARSVGAAASTPAWASTGSRAARPGTSGPTRAIAARATCERHHGGRRAAPDAAGGPVHRDAWTSPSRPSASQYGDPFAERVSGLFPTSPSRPNSTPGRAPR